MVGTELWLGISAHPRNLRADSTAQAMKKLSILVPALLAACSADPSTRLEFVEGAVPPTRKDVVVDDYHGTLVADPYRWLEDQDAPETLQWAAAQNRVTEAFLSEIPAREPLRKRLEALWNYERFQAPSHRGDWWVYRKNDGLQNQSVIYRARSPQDAGEALLDPNAMSEDGTVSVGELVLSADGTLATYSLSRAGSDWVEWRVLEVATGVHREDVVRWSKFGTAAWAHDNTGFFYTRYPAPLEDETYQAVNLNAQLCYHELGTDQASDLVVYENPEQPTWGYSGQVTDDGHYLVITIWEGTDRRKRVAYADLSQDELVVQPLFMKFDADYRFAGSLGTRFYFFTDHVLREEEQAAEEQLEVQIEKKAEVTGEADRQAGVAKEEQAEEKVKEEAKKGVVLAPPRRKLISFELATPDEAHWTEIIPPGDDPLAGVRLVGERWVAVYLRDAHHLVRIHTLDGAIQKELELPPLGSVGGFTGTQQARQTYFAFSSLTRPEAIYCYDFDSEQLSVWREPHVDFDRDAYQTQQVFFQSRDGTRVPMFLVHRKDLPLSGDHPTLLYGYGGFDISLMPRFSVQTAVWLERGGVFAQVNLRGGGEYGEEWHLDGMLGRKQNVFDDFLAAAHYLIRNDYTRPAKLAIWGRSNGGLLVGACLTQRPDLFGAAIPEVGVLDMLRFQLFTIGWAWVPEYGSSDDPEQFKTLYAYSPLHNIVPDTAYPATMVMTGDHDDRVLPGHSYKFTAALQEAQTGPNPILLRVEMHAGHGSKTPTAKQIEAATDRLTFLDWALRGE